MQRKSKWALERIGHEFEHSIRLFYGQNIIGRSAHTTIRITSNSKHECCSRQHCEIFIESNDEDIYIIDMLSSNGTYVNKIKCENRQKLNENDIIGIGCYDLNEALNNERMYIFKLRKIKNFAAASTSSLGKNQPECNNNDAINPEIEIINLIDDSDDDEERASDKVVLIIEKEKEEPKKTTNHLPQISVHANNVPEHNNEMPCSSRSHIDLMKPQNIVDIKSNSLNVSADKSINETLKIHSNKNEISIKSANTTNNNPPPPIITIVVDDDDDDEIQFFPVVDNKKPKSEEKNCLSPEILDISDDDSQYSQYLMQEMKQEIVDFDINESYSHLSAEKDINEDEKVDKNDNSNRKLGSPIYDYIDDSDDEELVDEKTANWLAKLSQSFKKEITVKYDYKVENDENDEKDKSMEEFKDDISEISDAISEPNSEFADDIKEMFNQENTIKKIVPVSPPMPVNIERNINDSTQIIIKSTKLIDAPFMSTTRKKHRVAPVKSEKEPKIIQHRKSIQEKERLADLDKAFKYGWKSKNSKEKQKLKLNTERKEKLKLLAEKETEKRKYIEINENKTTIKAKVKCTEKNRGAFLSEETMMKPNTTTTNSSKTSNNSKLVSSKEIKKLKHIPKIPQSQSQTLKPKQIIEHTSILNYPSTTSQSVKSPKEYSISVNSSMNKLTVTQESIINNNNNNNNNIIPDDIIGRKPEKLRFNSLTNHSNDTRKSLQDNDHRLELERQTAAILVKLDNSKIIKLNSILKKPCMKSNITVKKKVYFAVKPEIIYFNNVSPSHSADQNNQIHTNFNVDLSKYIQRKRLHYNVARTIDCSEIILSDILSWQTKWLDTSFEDVNGANHVLVPMMHCFNSLDEYKRILFPLMKLELWVRLQKEMKLKKFPRPITLQLSSFRVIDQNINSRIIFECQLIGNGNNHHQPVHELYIGEFVLLKICERNDTVFAYVRGSKRNHIMSNGRQCCQIILETAINPEITNVIHLIKNVNVWKLTPITIELGEFNAINSLENSPLLKKILNPRELITKEIITTNGVKYKGYDKLNEYQLDIVIRTYLKCIKSNQPNISLIEGPPGTGKSRIISNLSLQIMYGKEAQQLDRHILICAPSNTAIDEITLKLIHVRSKMSGGSNKFKLIRFGVNERMHPDVKLFSLENIININRKHNNQNDNSSLKKEKLFIEKRIKLLRLNHNHNSIEQDTLHKLHSELNRINALLNPSSSAHGTADKEQCERFLNDAHIICTTLSSCVKLLKYINYFDVCIIDEASQCNEPWTMIPLQFAINSLVLVGDKQQLPATVQSKLSKINNYGKSLFTRIQECLEHETDQNPNMTLLTQYRMHPEISHWPNLYFYKNQLINDQITYQCKMKIKPYSVFSLPFNQYKNTGNGNIINSLEAKFVVELVRHLKEILPFKYFKYGIITPYSSHRDYIIQMLNDNNIHGLEVNTIDSFQGKEKDVIIISNGRTDKIGFLNETPRINVCLTRAKKCLILCGNFINLEHNETWKSLLADAKTRKVYYKINESSISDFKNNIIKLISQ